MLRFALGITRMNKIRNGRIREMAHIEKILYKVRKARWLWFSHVMRRELSGKEVT